MLALIPTQFWLRHFNQSAQRLIDYAERSEWRDLLLDGWLSAATLHQEEEMAAALAEHFYGSNPAQLMRSLDALPSAYIEEKLKATLRQRNFILNNQEPATLLLFNYRRPWSDDLSRLFVAALQRTLQQPFVYPSFAWVSGQLAQIAQQISPDVSNEKGFDLRIEREDWAHMARYLDEFVALVHFRHDLKQAFAQP